jgi:energy-coupling factor transporter transmembrane protein EcfT
MDLAIGLPVLLLSILFFILIPSILVGIIAHIKKRDVFMWVLMSIFLFAPLILLILIFFPSLNEVPESTIKNEPKKFTGEKNIQSKEYVFYLTKKYNIDFEDSSNRGFKVAGKYFKTLDDAINYAHFNDIGTEKIKSVYSTENIQKSVNQKNTNDDKGRKYDVPSFDQRIESTEINEPGEEPADVVSYVILIVFASFFILMIYSLINLKI